MVLVAPKMRGRMAKSKDEKTATPTSRNVKLNREMFDSVWWVCRVEGISPGDLIEQVAGEQIKSRRKRYETEIEKLKRLDAETARIEQRAREKAE